MTITTTLGWKIFEVKNGQPRSLVHTFAHNNQRTRIFPVGDWVYADPNTKGFNFFLSEEAALRYLPRFRVRAPQLVICPIVLWKPIVHRSYYSLGTQLFIRKQFWEDTLATRDLYANYNSR